MALWTCFNTLLSSKRLDNRWHSKVQLNYRTWLASTPTDPLSPLVNTASLSWLDFLLNGAREKSNKDLKFCWLLRVSTVRRFNDSMPLRPLDCFLVLVAVFSCPCSQLSFSSFVCRLPFASFVSCCCHLRLAEVETRRVRILAKQAPIS